MPPKSKTQDPEILPTEPSTPQVEMLERGASLMRLENNTQMQIAIQRPRNEAVILKDALAELEIYPGMAEEAIYSKPVGKDPDTGKMKYAEGLSVRAAEALGNRWTNSARSCEILNEPQGDEDIIIGAIFLDYEKNIRIQSTKKVSRFYKARTGGVVQHAPDRFADLVIPAAMSKLRRNVTLEGLPPGLRKAYEDKARAIRIEDPIETRRKKIAAVFATNYKITQQKLEEYLGKSLIDFDHEDVDAMVGIYNRLKDGDTTIEKEFGLTEKLKTAGDSSGQPSLIPQVREPGTEG